MVRVWEGGGGYLQEVDGIHDGVFLLGTRWSVAQLVCHSLLQRGIFAE